MVRTLAFRPQYAPPAEAPAPATTPQARTCEHRTVSRDGRIVCRKIVCGAAEVSPAVCRTCPSRAVACVHLCFSLRLSSPSPLVVRHNGRTELWDDGPAELCFDRAACAVRVAPVFDPRACLGCALRQPLAVEDAAAPAARGKVVPFEAPVVATSPVPAPKGALAPPQVRAVAFPPAERLAAG